MSEIDILFTALRKRGCNNVKNSSRWNISFNCSITDNGMKYEFVKKVRWKRAITTIIIIAVTNVIIITTTILITMTISIEIITIIITKVITIVNIIIASESL